MSFLERIEIENFKIDDSITLEELNSNKENSKFLENKIIKVENVFSNFNKIILNKRKEELFLNGVMLTFDSEDGIYNIFSETQKYIGIGIIKNKLLKRDVVI